MDGRIHSTGGEGRLSVSCRQKPKTKCLLDVEVTQRDLTVIAPCMATAVRESARVFRQKVEPTTNTARRAGKQINGTAGGGEVQW